MGLVRTELVLLGSDGSFGSSASKRVCSRVGAEGHNEPLLTKDVEDKRPPQTLADDPSHKESNESPKSAS